MQEFFSTYWHLIVYVVMALVPFAIGFLTKASWHPLVKFLCVVAVSVIVALVSLNATDIPWDGENIGGFITSLIVAAEAVYMVFIKSFPAVQKWLDEHGVK